MNLRLSTSCLAARGNRWGTAAGDCPDMDTFMSAPFSASLSGEDGQEPVLAYSLLRRKEGEAGGEGVQET